MKRKATDSKKVIPPQTPVGDDGLDGLVISDTTGLSFDATGPASALADREELAALTGQSRYTFDGSLSGY